MLKDVQYKISWKNIGNIRNKTIFKHFASSADHKLQQLGKITSSARPIGNYVNSLYQPETGSQTQRKIRTKVYVSFGAINRTN